MGDRRLAYEPALDGIRAIAIILVVLLHAYVPGFAGGYFGVDVFFVLSGYLITRLLCVELDQTGKVDLRRFWVRRLWRLYPVLLMVLAIYLAVCTAAWPDQPFDTHFKASLIAGLYLSDYAWAFDASIRQLQHTWSLAVEEQFYLVWPLFLLLLNRFQRKHAILLLAALYVAAHGWRMMQSGIRTDLPLHFSFDTHATGLILGCLIGRMRPEIPKWLGWIGFMGVALTVYAFPTRDSHSILISFPLVEASSALLILSPPTWLGTPLLAWLGRLTYGWYLWHFPIMVWIMDQGNSWETVASLGGMISLACAAVSYYTVERWVRGLRARSGENSLLTERPSNLT
jgi:peptidoglycan/LPS O-acetylase OafA/YrhL